MVEFRAKIQAFERQLVEYEKQFKQDANSRWPMWPKVIQTNGTDVYIIGGNDSTPNTDNLPFQ